MLRTFPRRVPASTRDDIEPLTEYFWWAAHELNIAKTKGVPNQLADADVGQRDTSGAQIG